MSVKFDGFLAVENEHWSVVFAWSSGGGGDHVLKPEMEAKSS